MLDDTTGSARRPVSKYRCCTARKHTPLAKTPNQKRSATYLFTSAPASVIFVGPIEGVALDLHLQGSVRQKVDLVTYHIVVASLYLRESVRFQNGLYRMNEVVAFLHLRESVRVTALPLLDTELEGSRRSKKRAVSSRFT